MDRRKHRRLAPRSAASTLTLLLIVATALATSCATGKKLGFDADAIRERCAVERGVELTEEQALCIAGLAGLKNKKKCPSEVSEATDPADGSPVYRVRESCAEVGLLIARADGRIVGVELGDSVAHGDEGNDAVERRPVP
jgi:hypothetical protein